MHGWKSGDDIRRVLFVCLFVYLDKQPKLVWRCISAAEYLDFLISASCFQTGPTGPSLKGVFAAMNWGGGLNQLGCWDVLHITLFISKRKTSFVVFFKGLKYNLYTLTFLTCHSFLKCTLAIQESQEILK